MNNRFVDNDRDLNARLDRAVPAHNRTLGVDDADPLVRLAQRLAQGPDDVFSDAALDRVEERLNARMDRMPLFQTAAAARRRSYAKVRLARYAAAVALVLIVLIATVTQAAASTLPGDRLYLVKRMIEAARTAVVSQNEEAALRISLAERRTDEFEALLEQGRVYPRALEEAGDEMERALDLLAAGQGKWAEVDSKFRTLATRSTFLLDQAARRASPAEQTRLEAVAAHMVTLQQRSETLSPAGPPELPPTSPAPLLTVGVTVSPTGRPSPTATPTRTPTATLTFTATSTVTSIWTATATRTATSISSVTPTQTSSPAVTPLPPIRPTRHTPVPTEVDGPSGDPGKGPNANPTSAPGGENAGGGEKPQGGAAGQDGSTSQGKGK